MSLTKRFLGLALATPLVLAACGEESTFDLQLLHADCLDPARKAIPPASELTITITGEGMSDVEVKAAGSAGSVEMPEIPFGKNRVVVVRAHAGERLVAYGESAPFEVKESGTPPVRVVVKPVNAFSTHSDTSNACAGLVESRAGHVAVPLQDGRVLFAGGFHQQATAGHGTAFRKSAEIFDPATGRFERVADACDGDVCLQAGYSRAVLLPDGRVLITGGETAGEAGGGVAVATAMIYDPVRDSWTARSMKQARYGHTMHVLGNRVLIIGGRDETGAILGTTEVFNPATNEFIPDAPIPADEDSQPGGRAFHTGVVVNATTVVVAGGVNGTGAVSPYVLTFQMDKSGKVTPMRRQTALNTAVLHGTGGLLGGRVVIAGGTAGYTVGSGRWNTGDQVQAIAQSFDWTQNGGEVGQIALEKKRMGICGAALDADRILLVGGISADQPEAYAEVLTWADEQVKVSRIGLGGTVGDSRMATPRSWATCTSLGDGRVLVAGGVGPSGTGVLSSAEIFLDPRI